MFPISALLQTGEALPTGGGLEDVGKHSASTPDIDITPDTTTGVLCVKTVLTASRARAEDVGAHKAASGRGVSASLPRPSSVAGEGEPGN